MTYTPLKKSNECSVDSPRDDGDVEDGKKGRRSSIRSLQDLQITNPQLINLDEDVYGAVFFSLTFDISEVSSPHLDYDGLSYTVNLYRLSFTTLLLCANYVLQIGLVAWVYLYVALPSVHSAQSIYKHFHREVFHNGEFQQHLWDQWELPLQEQFCGIVFSKYWFVYAILCLWWIVMVREVQDTFTLYTKIMELPSTTRCDQMVYRTNDNDDHNHLLWQVTAGIRAILLLILFLPKLAIASGLWYVGTVWLAATDSFENLVLNSVALTFVTTIDELIFAGLIPSTMKRNISITKIVKEGEAEDHAHENRIKAAYTKATLILCIVVGGVAFYLSPWGQNIPVWSIFPEYAYDHSLVCPELWARQRARVCTAGEPCFPVG